MFREKIRELEEWKNSIDRKPLIIRGARQVGKTWLMKEFGEKYYKKCAYINMDENENMNNIFRDVSDIDRIVFQLGIEVGFKIDAEDTLIILDEIGEVPKALKSLKYFYEKAPQYHIIAAGSLLGVALHEGTSFPVGKVDFCDLYPLSFKEFLRANGEDMLVDVIDNRDFEIMTNFKNKLIDYLKVYYYVGGMPEVVVLYIKYKDMNKVRDVQNKLLYAYENDFSKHAPREVVTRIRMLWNSIPIQLAKENKKFIYGLVREGARAREYEVALTWLMDAGLIYKVNRVKKPDYPLMAYSDMTAFKLYILDVGLLGAMAGLNARIIIEGDRYFEEFKGAMTEQYVLQQLIVNKDSQVFYWTEERATAEVDFMMQIEDRIIPIEVKASENLKAKSLKKFVEKFNNQNAIRTSMSDYRKEEWMTNVPLYSVNMVKE